MSDLYVHIEKDGRTNYVSQRTWELSQQDRQYANGPPSGTRGGGWRQIGWTDDKGNPVDSNGAPTIGPKAVTFSPTLPPVTPLPPRTTMPVVDTPPGLDDPNAVRKDDFTKLTGIGAKVQEVLYANGIKTYADLSNVGSEVIANALDSANMGKQKGNITAWVEQAKQKLVTA